MNAAPLKRFEAPSVLTEEDRRFLTAAFEVGTWGMGQSWPNPAVGAIIVHKNQAGVPVIVGRGFTQLGGRPHAERVALDQAGDLARGSTFYVTLEPCSHFGRTSPCADALVDAGVARVVSAVEDPDPRVAGRGYQMLRDAGIELVTAADEDTAKKHHAGHINRIRRGRPHVMLKLAVSADDKIGLEGQGNVPVTGTEARDKVHMLRAHADAIMVGAETARLDDPQLTVRLPGMAHRSPIRVVIDSQFGISEKSKLLSDLSDAPVWIVGLENADERAIARLREAGAEIIQVPSGRDGRVSLPFALASLAARGITRLFCEGGATLASALLAGNLVDEWIVIRSKKNIGRHGKPALIDRDLSNTISTGRFQLTETRKVGADEMNVYWRSSDEG